MPIVASRSASVLRLEGFDDLGVQLYDRRARRAGGHEDAEPRREVEPRQPGLRDRRQIGHRGRALARRHRERAQLPRLHLRQRVGEVVEHELRLAGEEVLHRRRAALVGDVHHVDAGHRLEELAGEMPGRAGRARAERERAGLRPRVVDQLAHRLHRQRGVDDEDVRHLRDQRHRHEVLLRVVRDLRVQARVDRVRAHRAHQQRVAVAGRLGDEVRADAAARAGAVVDDDRLAPRLLQLLRDAAAHDVERPAGRERHHEADRLGRIGLRGGRRRADRARRRQRQQQALHESSGRKERGRKSRSASSACSVARGALGLLERLLALLLDRRRQHDDEQEQRDPEQHGARSAW